MTDLNDIPVAFSNSREAVIFALQKGLNPHVCVRTSSLALYKNPPGNVVVELHNENISPSEVTGLLQGLASIAEKFFLYLQERDVEHSLCVDISRTMYWNQAFFYNAMLLNEADFTEPRAILELKGGCVEKDAQFNIPWYRLISGNKNVQVITAPSIELQKQPLSGMVSPSFWNRLKNYTREYFEYRAWLLFWKIFPKRFSRGIIGVAIANPLMRETALYLARKGYALSSLDSSFSSEVKQKVFQYPDFSDFLEASFREELSRFYCKPLLDVLWSIVSDNIKDELLSCNERVMRYRDHFLQKKPGRFKAVLSNMPDPALHFACKENAILLAGFQHGHSREISTTSQYYSIYKEQAVCDLLMTFNEKAAEISNRNKFSVGSAFAVGVPQEYIKLAKNSRTSKCSADFLYISTNLLTLTFGNLSVATHPDCKKDNFEALLIKEVFSKINQKITFKPYLPDTTYPENFVKQMCDQYSNVDYFDSGYDLIYLLRHSRLLITSRATSTLGWCLMSKRPLVFINFPENMPLKPELEKPFRNALFYFDGSDPKIFVKLRNFLRQSLSVIEHLWKSMEVERNELIRQYFSTAERKAGLTAANIIYNNIKEVKNVRSSENFASR